MMLRSYILCFALMLGLSGGLNAQDRQQARTPDDGWIAMMLQMRHQLRLSPEQIVQLRRIDDETENLNRPHVSAIRQIRNKARALGPFDQLTREQRGQFEAFIAEGRPHQDKINQNIGAAMGQVRRVLTTWQNERLRELLNNSSNRDRSSHSPPAGRPQ